MTVAPASDAARAEATPSPPRGLAGFFGHLRLVAARDDAGRTQLARQSFCAPFHLAKPYWDGRVLQVQVVNATAGILAGDRLELEVRVEPGASLLVTTPAATRAYAMRGGAARCSQLLQVAAGGWLEYAPEPLFPHRDSDYAQTTRLEAAAGADVFFVDAVAPGRVGRGECWAWRRLRLGLDVEVGGEPVLRERLDASGAELARAAEFFGTPGAWFATVVALGPAFEAAGAAWDEVRALHAGGCRVGATSLRRGGWVARIVAPGGQALRDVLAALRAALAPAAPALRADLRKL